MRRLGARLRGLLFSPRPRWALMPGFVAENFIDNLLFTLSACEREGIRYAAHFGTLLGAHRLGGVCPWDEDADIFLVGEDRASVERKLGALLREHGFDLVWEPNGGFFWVRQSPWWAGQGHIALEFLPAAPATGTTRLPDWDPWIPPEQLHPLSRYPFHETWISGPGDAEGLLGRLYGATGSQAVMSRWRRPRVPAATEAFWRAARSPELDWARISTRILDRRRQRPWGHVATFPWWWFNGGYNVAIRQLRRLGSALASPGPRS